MTAQEAFHLTVRLFGGACVILGAERLAGLWKRSPWACLNAAFSVENGRFTEPGTYFRVKAGLQAGKIACGILCLALPWLAPMALAFVLAAGAVVLITDRTLEYVGGDGADQQLRIIGGALCLTGLAGFFDPDAAETVLWFLAAQLACCYSVSGCLKARNADWRSGDAIRSISAARDYGRGALAPLLSMHSSVAVLMAWSVIVFECGFPLFFLAGNFALAGLGLVLLFHFLISVFMGLNSFLWVFPISYPAFYFCANQLQQVSNPF